MTIPEYAIRCAAWAIADVDPQAAKYKSDASLIDHNCAMIRAALPVLNEAIRAEVVKEIRKGLGGVESVHRHGRYGDGFLDGMKTAIEIVKSESQP